MPKSTGRKKRQRETERRECAANAGRMTQNGQNIGEIERVVSSILGGTLLLGGLARRSLPGLAIAATGAAFLYRGATGHCKVYESLGLDTYCNALNSDRSEGLLHETARLKESIEEEHPLLETEMNAHHKSIGDGLLKGRGPERRFRHVRKNPRRREEAQGDHGVITGFSRAAPR